MNVGESTLLGFDDVTAACEKGHIEFFRPVSYWDAFELSYQLYDDRHAGRGDSLLRTDPRPWHDRNTGD